ncbi:hypothetical protein ACTXT7_005353 [Hymenolepis weldensis]
MTLSVERFKKMIDKDGSGSVDLKELFAAPDNPEINEDPLKEFIQMDDKNDDGKLGINELRKFLEEVGC